MWVRVPPAVPGSRPVDPVCAVGGRPTPCFDPDALGAAYAYLLGLYLGDGSLSCGARDVWRLRITMDDRYPLIIERAKSAILDVRGRVAGATIRQGCVDVSSYWKHWICCFPQHGVGEKHKRDVRLLPWQRSVVAAWPAPFIAGLIHSDGCRCLNHVNGYTYPRYFFSNRSPTIRTMFVEACRVVGVDTRPAGPWNISVARRDSVARLDRLIPPKA